MLSRLLGLLLAAVWASVASGKKYSPYLLVVDAGSSGSRLRIYKEVGDEVNQVELAEEDEDSFECEPGLSSYSANPEDAGSSLKPLLNAAKKYIPQRQRRKTRLWIKATAGMRLVDRADIGNLFKTLSEYLSKPKNCPFKFVNAEILAGEEEALFAWLSVNFNLGKLGQGPNVTNGILDMGGDSMQIAYNPGINILNNEFSFYVEKKLRSVYAVSWIKFGLVKMIERAMDMAVDKIAKDSAEVDYPCYNKGYSEEKEVNGKSYTFKGTGDFKACSELVDGLLGLDMDCIVPNCTLWGQHLAPVQVGKKFWGLSNYFYIPNGLGLIDWNEHKALTPKSIHDAAESFCGKDKEDAAKVSGAPWKYQKLRCIGGIYQYKALKSFGFSDDDTSITYARKIKGKSADWSLGAVLYESRLMPVEQEVELRECEQSEFPRYIVYLEAGSSESRLHVYKQTSPMNMEPVGGSSTSFRMGPCMFSKDMTPEKAGECLKPMMDAAHDLVPKKHRKTARFSLKATGEVRLFEPKVLENIFGHLGGVLKSEGYTDLPFSGAGVLSGEEDAVMTWISLNSIHGTLDVSADTRGIIDMTNTSVNIAFRPEGDILSKEFAFYLNSSRQSLYAKSFIQFGLESMVERAKKAAAEDAEDDASKVDFPCFNKGYSEEGSHEGGTIVFEGTGDAAACATLVESLLGLDVPCLMEPCALGGVPMAPVQDYKRFTAISHFFTIAKNLGLVEEGESKELTPKSLDDAAVENCGKTSEEAETAGHEHYACLGGLLAYRVLKSFGFPDDTEHITFASEVNGRVPHWSLGAAVFENSLMPESLETECTIGEVEPTLLAEVWAPQQYTSLSGTKAAAVPVCLAAVGLLVLFAQRVRRAAPHEPLLLVGDESDGGIA